jgi:lipopolysaccharide transport system permease protein
MNALAEFAQSRELLANLTLRELRGKYKRSLLGWTWSLLNPISLMVIYTIVFGGFLGVKIDPGNPSGINSFPVWLMCGLLPWNFVSQSLTGSMAMLIGNAGLIKKVYFPRELLPFSLVLSLDVSFLIEMGVLCAFIVIVGAPMVVPWMIPTLFVVVAITAYAAGLGLMFSVLNVYFRDVQYLVGILMNLWFYLTPIVYPMSYVDTFAANHGSIFLTLYKINPMVEFVLVFRSLLYDQRAPGLASVAYILAWGVGMLLVGLWVFRRYEGRLAEEL